VKIQKSTNVLDIQVYNNKLNKIKDVAKKNYFKLQCNMNKDNLKTTWKLIGTIFTQCNRRNSSKTKPNKTNKKQQQQHQNETKELDQHLATLTSRLVNNPQI